jgi:hypothetical protein
MIETELDKLADSINALSPEQKEPIKKLLLGFICLYLKGDITKEELDEFLGDSEDRKILSKILDNDNKPLYGELFPIFKPQKNIHLKKEFALNFGNVGRLKKDYVHLLDVKLMSGKTLAQQLDEVENWFTNLHGENLGLWIKLFGFISAVKAHKEDYANTADLQEIKDKDGVYFFRIKTNKKFYDFFIRPDAKMKKHTTKAKQKFLSWLKANSDIIRFPCILSDGGIMPDAIKVFDCKEIIRQDKTTELIFYVDTNILSSAFNDYVNIDINEIDLIADTWQTITNNNNDFKKYRLTNFEDLPLKFLLTLKLIYNSGGNFTTKAGFHGNVQTLKKEKLNEHLGNLNNRVSVHAKKREYNAKIILKLLLGTVFDISVTHKWLLNIPTLENGIYHFNINRGYFDTQNTAKLLTNKR